MRKPAHHPLKDLRGAVRLVVDGSRGVVDVVESMHGTIQRWTLPVGRPSAERAFGITGLVYRGVRKGIDWVGSGLDAALQPWIRMIPQASEPSPRRDALLAALNGVWGDHLVATDNPLALPMSVRWTEPLDPASDSEPERLIVLMHGLCMDDRSWTTRSGHDHGAGLAERLGFVPVYLQYNTGLSVADNGRSLAALMEVMVDNWPRSVETVTLLGYSMGGLVARSACHWAELESLSWRSKLEALMTLGTPHLGSPVERAGTWVDAALDFSAYSAPLARLTRRRSAGIRDLGHGNVTDVDRQTIPLPVGVRCYALAGARTPAEPEGPQVPASDGLVPVDSALGRHPQPDRSLAFPEAHRAVVSGVSHLGLLASRPAFDHLVRWAGSR